MFPTCLCGWGLGERSERDGGFQNMYSKDVEKMERHWQCWRLTQSTLGCSRVVRNHKGDRIAFIPRATEERSIWRCTKHSWCIVGTLYARDDETRQTGVPTRVEKSSGSNASAQLLGA